VRVGVSTAPLRACAAHRLDASACRSFKPTRCQAQLAAYSASELQAALACWWLLAPARPSSYSTLHKGGTLCKAGLSSTAGSYKAGTTVLLDAAQGRHMSFLRHFFGPVVCNAAPRRCGLIHVPAGWSVHQRLDGGWMECVLHQRLGSTRG
jgi:hypothetical protein